MQDELLLDTGALVSLLDRSQRSHEDFVRFFETWQGQVVSSEAVLTEATHLLGLVYGGRKACLDFFLAGGAVLVPSTPSSIRRCRELMEQYDNLPMDFADATLVHVANREKIQTVFTLDRRDFSVYRLARGKAFTIIPD